LLVIITRGCRVAYKQMDFQKRCQIYGLWRAGYNQSQIAKEVGVHKSTISREFKRNIVFVRTALGSWQYKPNYAQTYTEERHKKKRKQVKFTREVEVFVREKVLQDWSPDQICGYAKRHNLFQISHERIYQFLLKDRETGGDLYKHLRHQNKKYRKRYGSPKRQSPIKNRRFIDDRPAIVNDKLRIGDWEIDTIIGKNHKQAIITIVERVSKKTVMRKVQSKSAGLVASSIISSLKPFSNRVFTITGDNGVEFAYHEKVSKELEADFYFAHPYSSWERGLNENTNGLIRQYLKKGSDFSILNEEDLELIMNKLNNRPRKDLNYSTPNEIFAS
jgi:IS30 family transposase